MALLGTIAKALALLVVLFASGVAVVAVVASLSDGPIGPFAGGALSGEPTGDGRFDFDDPAGARIELQVNPESPRSVTVWGFEYEGNLYAPSVFAERKAWPKQLLRDPRVVVRWKGELHSLTAARVLDPALLAELHARVATADTRASPERLADPGTWYFRFSRRTSDGRDG